ncbi:hypothetical protein BW12_07095 [Bifidobacterium sp. UTCIF-3]|uniref:fibronectin type III domain-containing protein n=1 Tax=unclassified Bifidobacterium TaxID=2608897 RepID=UPI00112D78EA|nr:MULTISPECIES: fibronectin type III domain-containing protein [unclassified Bifidobacterium]TPF78347.1 hypothetical protein BW09_04650 [Bifidobacterium sp. UTCIF-1]TPF81232.1 hypothetical protein BW08_00930 [Bifidobacterium sp. UTCIF-24]TPF82013.1 hypothetical protein BW12_07095 [Bifidobacterium sp. UTCIF-3]TPF85139.1 hypothetical protein BW07_00255 [Bifidobacterium sp. UTCIF-36]
MADGYGNGIGNWRCHVAAWVTSYDDTSDVIHVEARWQAFNGWYYYGWVAATVWVNGQQVNHTDNSGTKNTGTNGEVTVLTGDLRVAKTEGSRNITCSASIYFNGTHAGTSNASCGVPVGGIRYRAPRPPRNVNWSRVDDSATNLTWTGDYDGGYPQPWKQVIIDRIIYTDGATTGVIWGNVATLGWSATNYRATGQKPNSKIGYAVYARNQAGDSSHVDLTYLYTTPTAPATVSAVKSGASTVTVSVDASKTFAYRLQVQRSLDSQTWEDVGEVRIPSNGKVSWEDTAAPAGTVYYRARYTRPVYGDDTGRTILYSGWTASNSVTTITPPSAPTIINPTQGATYDIADGLTVSWKPNHPDGSAQSAAQIEYTVGTQTYPTLTVQGARTDMPIDVGSFTGTWKVRVRTKGLHADWGAWSDYISFTLANPPNVVITRPGVVITELPFQVAWSVSDATGVSQQRVTISRAGVTAYEATPAPGVTSLTVNGTDFLPANGSEFTVSVTVRGGSTLTATTSKLVTAEYTPPAPPRIETTVDPDTLYATHTVRYGDTAGDDRPSTVRVMVRRVIDDDTVTLSDGLADGHQVIDPLPPLRYAYTLEAVAIASSGANSVTRSTVLIDTDMCCLNFGADAKEALPVGGAFTVSEKPELATEEYHFASGDMDGLPVSYQMRDLDNTVAVSSRYDWGDGSLYRLIRRLSRAYAYGWFRNMDGSRMRVRVSMSQKIAADGLTVDFSASLDEIVWKEPER